MTTKPTPPTEQAARTLKGLLLEMKLAPTVDQRILAEESIVIMFEDLKTELAAFNEYFNGKANRISVGDMLVERNALREELAKLKESPFDKEFKKSPWLIDSATELGLIGDNAMHVMTRSGHKKLVDERDALKAQVEQLQGELLRDREAFLRLNVRIVETFGPTADDIYAARVIIKERLKHQAKSGGADD